VALFGFLLMGLGCSSVYPLAVSAAAQRTDRPASVNVASLGQMTFVVFFLGRRCSVRRRAFRYPHLVPDLPAADRGGAAVIRALAPKPVPILGEPEPATPHG